MYFIECFQHTKHLAGIDRTCVVTFIAEGSSFGCSSLAFRIGIYIGIAVVESDFIVGFECQPVKNLEVESEAYIHGVCLVLAPVVL